jgi:adenylate cyclase class IV
LKRLFFISLISFNNNFLIENTMIQVEKKFLLSEQKISELIKDADAIGERTFTDEYFDDSSYSLTSRDMWLRKREGVIELKTPLFVDDCERVVDQYEGLEKEDDIRQALDISKEGDLEQDLAKKGFSPFVKLTTVRRKFKKDGFVFNFDTVEFDDFTYSIAEIEKSVSERSKMDDAVSEIMDYAGKHGLESAMVRSKVLEYIRRKDPKHFQVLSECKICN